MSRTHTVMQVAVRWLLLFHSRGQSKFTPEELDRWKAWSAVDAHFCEFCRAEALWRKLLLVEMPPRPTDTNVASEESDAATRLRRSLPG